MKLLVPETITYLAKVASLSDETEEHRLHTPAVEEIFKALVSLLPAVPESSRMFHFLPLLLHLKLTCNYILGPAMFGILLPTLSLFLSSSTNPTSSLPTVAVSHLLTLATTWPVAFKEAAAKLDQEVRDTLEGSIRQAVGGKKAASQPGIVKPQISLRSF